MSRRRFLGLGGGGLMAASLLGGAGCGGGGEGGGGDSLVFAFNSTGAEGLRELICRFNEDHRGEIRVEWREMPATSSQYFEHMQAELQSGESNVDVIAGDVTWAVQFAANGYILDLSERFSDRMKESHLDGPLQIVEYEGKTWGVPWFTDAGMFFYRRDLLERAGFSEPPATWAETYYSDMSLEMARQFNAALKGEVPGPQALEELERELQNIANQGCRRPAARHVSRGLQNPASLCYIAAVLHGTEAPRRIAGSPHSSPFPASTPRGEAR